MGISDANRLAWAMQLGYAVIPSSTNRAELERGHRLTSPKRIAPTWD